MVSLTYLHILEPDAKGRVISITCVFICIRAAVCDKIAPSRETDFVFVVKGTLSIVLLTKAKKITATRTKLGFQM